MRPNGGDVLAGLSASLAQHILPELATPWAQAELRSVMGLIETMAAEWDGAAEALLRENSALAAACMALGANSVVKAALRQGVLAQLQAAAELPPSADVRISTLVQLNGQLWEILVPVLESIGSDQLGDEAAAAARDVLRPLLRANAAASRLRRR